MLPDLLATKMHVADDGNVWTLQGDQEPRASDLQLVPYLVAHGFPLVTRVVGCHNNAQLILALARHCYDSGYRAELCSPVVCRTAKEFKDPIRVLLSMRQFDRAGSLGGWHELKNKDAVTYALISHVRKGADNDLLGKMIVDHPVWPALSFVPSLDRTLTAFLLAEIVDPRWFIDIKHTNRGSKLRNFLGLDMRTMFHEYDINRKDERTVKDKRFRLVRDCWYSGEDVRLLDKPDNFLHRIVKKHEENGSKATGLLRACQTFVEFLRLSWLASLGSARHQLEALFVPGHFFTNVHEVNAFNEHMRGAIK